VEWTISDLFPPGTTGSICLKSPPNTTVFPPKISFQGFPLTLIISFNDLSKASKQNLCAIGASSHIIHLVCFKSSANSVPFSILKIND